MPELPKKALPDDAVDMAAKAIAAEVAHHIRTMYPGAAEAIAWESCKRSLTGMIRNRMKLLGEAAERGDLDFEIEAMRRRRRLRKNEECISGDEEHVFVPVTQKMRMISSEELPRVNRARGIKTSTH